MKISGRGKDGYIIHLMPAEAELLGLMLANDVISHSDPQVGLSTAVVEDELSLTGPYWNREGPAFTIEAAGDLAAELLKGIGGFDRAIDNWNTAKVLSQDF